MIKLRYFLTLALALPLMLAAAENIALGETAPDGARMDTCFSCHADPDLKAVTPRGAGLRLFITRHDYERSAHGRMECVTCHIYEQGKTQFEAAPHGLDEAKLPLCMNCHEKSFAHITEQLAQSKHFKELGDKITCTDCHDPHTLTGKNAMDTYQAAVQKSNAACVNCHTSKIRYFELTGKEVYTQDISHEFLPKRDRHFAGVRCVDCHTPTDKAAGSGVHVIMPKEDSLRDCSVCHRDAGSFFLERVATFTDMQQGAGSMIGKGLFDDADFIKRMRAADIELVSNQPLVQRVVSESDVKESLEDKYVPGLGQTASWDSMANRFLLLVLLGLAVHSLLRFIAGRKKPGRKDTPGEKIYPIGIRSLHWTNALFFLVLISTGFSIHSPAAVLALPLEFSVSAHNITGVLLIANFTAFLLYAVVSGEIKQYIPAPSGLFGRLVKQLSYYLYGIFTGAEKPYHTTAESRLNPVQQFTYLLAYCLGVPVLICSGLLLMIPDLAVLLLPETSTRLLATAHYLLAVGYLAFLMLHVYMITTGTRVFSLLKGMITGRHYT